MIYEAKMIYEEKIIWHEISIRPPTEEEIEEYKEKKMAEAKKSDSK